MNGQPDGHQEVLQVAELQQIDRACEHFQAAWEDGKQPRIEDYLAAASDNCRSELLQRLVAQELICRSRSGETPTPEEYERRFPADASTVRQAFSRSPRSPADRSEHSTHSNQNAAAAETETQQWENPKAQETHTSEQPEHIGRYKVTGILGRGGFGTVYRARDEELQRDVAIKVWRRDRFAGDEQVEQLLQEARLVARLDKHPAIVGVYDVGRQEDGSAFVVFEYIEGHSLEQEMKSHKLAPDRVWEIMMQVTSAIQHAHATGLVHRDLKPANVLLDGDGNAHVADFGLAIDDQSQRFHAGEVSGTPAYMAPEQVRGEAHRLDGRADLWALGVMLYETLTRRRPFQGQTHQELFDEILHREPKPPRQLDPEIPADLERICLKCLTKSVTERYLTAADLAKDLRHAQEAPQRRKRRLVTIVSAVAAGLVVLGAVWAYIVVAGSQPVISVQPGSGLQIRHRATLRGHTDAVWSVAFSPDDRTLASAGVDMTVKLWDVPDAHEIQQLTGHRGEVRCVAFAPDGKTLASASNDRSIMVWVRETGEMQRQLTGHTGDVRSVAYLQYGKQLVSGSVDKSIRFWDPQTGSEQKKTETHKAAIQSVACSRDGATLASSSDDKTIELLSAETGELLRTLTGHTDGVSQAAFSPDGRRLASASWDKTIRIWDVATGKLLRTIDKQQDAVRSVAFSPDGKRLASGGNDNTIRLWAAETGQELATLRGHTGPVTSVAFSSDGRILASASSDKTVMMWELEEAQPPKPENRSIVKQSSRKQSKPPASASEPPDTKSQVASDGKAPVPATEPKRAEWVPLVKSEEDLKAWQKTGPGTVTFDSGDVRVQNAAVTYPTPAADLAIRTQIQNEVNVKPNVRLLLRETPAGSYAAVLENGSRLVVGVTEGEEWRELKSVPVDVPAGQPLVLEFSAVGNLLTVLLNGKPAIEVQDATYSYGSPGLAAGDGTTVFKDIRVNAARGQEPGLAKTPEKPPGSVPSTTAAESSTLPWDLPKDAPPPAIAPFDAARAKEHQAAWAKHLGVEVESENFIGMRFVLIPPGEFDMGSTEAEVAKLLEQAKATNQPPWYIERLPAEAPKHRVRITKPFWLGVHEVTRGQFRRFVDERGYKTEAERDGKGGYGLVNGQWKQDSRFVWNRDLGFEQADDHPVVNVTWNDVTAFCVWLSEKEGEKSDLPSEAQWEYACRAGTTTKWYPGDDAGALKEHAWFKDNAGDKTHPVGQKRPNAWGLYDVHGNAWEWCQDWWGDRYYATSPMDDPPGVLRGSDRMHRGGGWNCNAGGCRAALRGWMVPSGRFSMLGFRLARIVSLTESGAASPQKSGDESPQSKDRPTPEPSGPAAPPPAPTPVPPWTLPAGAPPPAIAPFDAAKAKEHQQAWAKHLGVPVEYENSIGMKFMLIPPGEFNMGSTEEEVATLLEQAKATNQQSSWYIERLPTEAPKHRVRITKSFWLGRHEVTRGQFRRFVEDRGYQTEAERDGKGGRRYVDGQWNQDQRFVWNADLGFEQTDDHPVATVSWNDVTAFSRWLSEKEGETSQLPTEAQWEYACRAGTTTTWNSGDDEGTLKEHGWFSFNSESRSHPVGQKSPNAWGLYDMHGNVWEWCQDWWAVDYYGASPLDDPTGASEGSARVLRGGGWRDYASRGRASFSDRSDPGTCHEFRGFRLARTISLTESGAASPRKSGDESPQSKDRPTPEPAASPTIPPAASAQEIAFLLTG